MKMMMIVVLALASGCIKKREKASVAPLIEQAVGADPSTQNDALANMYLIDGLETDHPVYTESTVSFALADDSFSAKTLDRATEILFDLADKDDSDQLNLNEFLVFRAVDISLPSDTIENIQDWRKKLFENADTDKNSNLSRSEARIMLENIGDTVKKMREQRESNSETYTSVYWQALLERYDTNRDGKLSRDERKQVTKNAKEETEEARVALKDYCSATLNQDKPSCKAYELMRKFCQGTDLSQLSKNLCSAFVAP